MSVAVQTMPVNAQFGDIMAQAPDVATHGAKETKAGNPIPPDMMAMFRKALEDRKAKASLASNELTGNKAAEKSLGDLSSAESDKSSTGYSSSDTSDVSSMGSSVNDSTHIGGARGDKNGQMSQETDSQLNSADDTQVASTSAGHVADHEAFTLNPLQHVAVQGLKQAPVPTPSIAEQATNRLIELRKPDSLTSIPTDKGSLITKETSNRLSSGSGSLVKRLSDNVKESARIVGKKTKQSLTRRSSSSDRSALELAALQDQLAQQAIIINKYDEQEKGFSIKFDEQEKRFTDRDTQLNTLRADYATLEESKAQQATQFQEALETSRIEHTKMFTEMIETMRTEYAMQIQGLRDEIKGLREERRDTWAEATTPAIETEMQIVPARAIEESNQANMSQESGVEEIERGPLDSGFMELAKFDPSRFITLAPPSQMTLGQPRIRHRFIPQGPQPTFDHQQFFPSQSFGFPPFAQSHFDHSQMTRMQPPRFMPMNMQSHFAHSGPRASRGALQMSQYQPTYRGSELRHDMSFKDDSVLLGAGSTFLALNDKLRQALFTDEITGGNTFKTVEIDEGDAHATGSVAWHHMGDGGMSRTETRILQLPTTVNMMPTWTGRSFDI